MEIFKTIEGYPRFQISNLGRVKNLNYKNRGKEVISNQFKAGIGGYSAVQLCEKGRAKVHLVHRLVAEYFLNKKPWHTDVNHIDGNKENNRVENLAWTTHSENIIHRNRELNKGQGETHSRAKLTNQQVVEIRELLNKGVKNKDIAQKFRVTPQHIYNIKKNLSRKEK